MKLNQREEVNSGQHMIKSFESDFKWSLTRLEMRNGFAPIM